MPKKLKCRKLLRSEEQLFLHGLKLYHKKINLANFLRKVDEIEEEVTEIKASLGKDKKANGNGIEDEGNDSQQHLMIGPATNDPEDRKKTSVPSTTPMKIVQNVQKSEHPKNL